MIPGDLLARYGPRALILGGSEGIGASFAEALAAAGFALTLVARRAAPLERAAAMLRDRHEAIVDVETLDLTTDDIAKHAEALLDRADPGLLIYNAGATHGIGLFADQPVERALALARLNCLGPLAFAHGAMTRMRSRRRGGIILVSSMSGLAGSGYVATYAAAKAFEITLAEGLNWEAARDGIDVLCLVASLTGTPAMARSGMRLDGAAGFVPMQPDEVAAGALAALGSKAAHFAAGTDAADAMRTAPRAAVIDGASRAAMELWGLEDVPGAGRQQH